MSGCFYDRLFQPSFTTPTFSDVFGTSDDFGTAMDGLYEAAGVDSSEVKDKYAYIWMLLASKYAFSHIATQNLDAFKMKLWRNLHQYGPSFLKRMELQERIRTMTSDEIRANGIDVVNHSYNPSTSIEEETANDGILTTVNDQNTTANKMGALAGAMSQYASIDDGIITDFLDRFKSLFIVVIESYQPLWYESED